MRGVGGKPGWAWIFILEGLATVLIGIASYWMVHDFPDDAKFLSPDDRVRVLRRLKADGQASAEKENFKMAYFWESVKDWKTWAFAVIYMGCDGPLYAFSLFLPTIIRTANPGITSTRANLLSVPPYAAAAILTISIGWYADRTRRRGWCNIGVSFLGIAGFAMLLGSQDPWVKYAGTFLGALGICEYLCVPKYAPADLPQTLASPTPSRGQQTMSRASTNEESPWASSSAGVTSMALSRVTCIQPQLALTTRMFMVWY